MKDFFQKNDVHVRPEFPNYKQKTGISGIFAYLFAIIFWILAIILFLVAAYTQWFTNTTVYLLNLIHPKQYYIPFWFSLILVILVFPLTLFIVLLGTFIKILRG